MLSKWFCLYIPWQPRFPLPGCADLVSGVGMFQTHNIWAVCARKDINQLRKIISHSPSACFYPTQTQQTHIPRHTNVVNTLTRLWTPCYKMFWQVLTCRSGVLKKNVKNVRVNLEPILTAGSTLLESKSWNSRLHYAWHDGKLAVFSFTACMTLSNNHKQGSDIPVWWKRSNWIFWKQLNKRMLPVNPDPPCQACFTQNFSHPAPQLCLTCVQLMKRPKSGGWHN